MATLKQFTNACDSIEAKLMQKDTEIAALKAELRTVEVTNGALKRRSEAAEKRAKTASKELEICQSELRVKNSKLAHYARSILQLKKELNDIAQPMPKQVESEARSEDQAEDNHALISGFWDGRERSRLIRHLMLNAPDRPLTYADVGECLGTTEGYANNKMTRNSFSIEDVVRVAKRAGYTVMILKDSSDIGVTLGFDTETNQLTIEKR